MKADAATQTPRPSVAVRFLDEILLVSGQYALFYVLMNFADQGSGFFSDLGHTSLLLTLLLQTAVLVAWGRLPLVRFLGSLITPAIYAAFEVGSLSAFILDISHFNFWFFSALVGGLQAMALLARRGRARAVLEFLSTFFSVVIFLVVYFYFDVRVTHEQMVAAGTLPAGSLAAQLSIGNYGTNLVEFLSDTTHVYVVIGGILLAFALARGRVKIVRLSERISELFGTYVDGRVRDRIMSGDGARGETREVAILFSDMRDFTGLSESFAAAQVVEMLNAYFSEWDRVSQRHGGIIDKFMGDAVMIVFEPGAAVHPANGAVACALEMLAGLERLRAHVTERGLPNPRGIGVGIAYGPVIMGNIGSARRRNYTVIGDFVNTAARLESACKEFGKRLIISEDVFRMLESPLRARFSPLGQISLKGKADNLPVYGLRASDSH